MSHYAVISPPLFSHLRALQALAQQLVSRGHQVTFIQQAGALKFLSDSEINLAPLAPQICPAGALAHTLKLAAKPGGLAIFSLIADMAHSTDILCRELPGMLDKLAVDGLIVDQMEPAGGLVAEALNIPFVSVACALPVNREEGMPLPVMPFNWATDQRARKLYQHSQRIYDWMMRGHNRVINRHARAFGLPARAGLHECLSPLAQISQTISAFDFPRRALPENFHAVGPLRASEVSQEKGRTIPSQRPFVFASLGTLQGHRYHLFKTIARACRQLDVQLLVAHCGGLNADQAASLRDSGASWVTDFADQNAVMQQAQAVITHGGLNTVADAITHQTPILAMPIAFDQPGVAARVCWSGIGRRVSRFSRSETLADNLSQLLSDNRYRQRLGWMQAELNQAGGAVKAATIVEQALSPGYAAYSEAAS